MLNFSFRPHKEGLNKILGDLETQVMEVLWQRHEASVREVWKELNAKRPLAYTTVLSTMRNLHEKNYLARSKSGITHIYTPTSTKDDLIRRVVDEVVNGLVYDFAAPFLASLADLKHKKDLTRTIERVEELLEKTGREDIPE